jgi:cell volume regulation protein A
VNDLEPFAADICLVAAVVLAAVLSNKVSSVIRVPAPAIFLVTAAVASDIFSSLRSLPIQVDERIVTVALIFILFDGGMHIGWARFRSAAGAVVWVGVAGTVATAAALALAAHWMFDFDWKVALLLGTALAPTDPAVVFSVLSGREISGRTGTILEGESGTNDPVGIAVVVSVLGATGGGMHAALEGAGEFALQMTVGAAVGVVGGLGVLRLMRRVSLPNEALYPLQAMAGAALVYGAATVLHGSGFLAVFLAGIVVGDARAPYKREIERFSSGLASLAEIVAFVVLGLSVPLRDALRPTPLWTGLALAGLLILVVRPVFVGLLMSGISLARGERVFVLWAGLKGAVPILLGLFIVSGGVARSGTVYEIIFVAVLASVVIQGGLVPAVAALCRVPMRTIEPEPWALGMRFRHEPAGQHLLVTPGSLADGRTVGSLDIGESAWISMVSRDGGLLRVRDSTTLRAGDEVLALSDEPGRLVEVFGRPPSAGPST